MVTSCYGSPNVAKVLFIFSLVTNDVDNFVMCTSIYLECTSMRIRNVSQEGTSIICMHSPPRLLWSFPRMEWCCWWVLAAFLTWCALLHPLFEVTIHARPPHILSCELLRLGWSLCTSSTTLLRNLGGTTTLFPLNRKPCSSCASSDGTVACHW